jgi:succinate dehydrogenase/fumarate reductase flavoprotein subunit
MGGNSTKATSGINGAATRQQRALGIADTLETFEADTAKSAAGGKEGVPISALGRVLTHESGAAVEWLVDRFGLDLSLVSRLGGHSQPRTHRGKERFPGMTITMALMEKLEDIAKATPALARVILSARVNKLLTDSTGVIGVQYEKDGRQQVEYGPVIIATGGYAADFGPDSLLRKYRPDLLDRGLPTTNGEHCTGDGIRIAEAIGAAGSTSRSAHTRATAALS